MTSFAVELGLQNMWLPPCLHGRWITISRALCATLRGCMTSSVESAGLAVMELTRRDRRSWPGGELLLSCCSCEVPCARSMQQCTGVHCQGTLHDCALLLSSFVPSSNCSFCCVAQTFMPFRQAACCPHVHWLLCAMLVC